MKLSPNGFTMVELLAAIVVLNLLVAGLTQLFLGQNQMVNSLEDWCEGEPVFQVVPEADSMARILGVPATLSKKDARLPKKKSSDTPYVVEVVEIRRDLAQNQASVEFLQVKAKDSGGEDNQGSKGNKKTKRDKGDKKSGKD